MGTFWGENTALLHSQDSDILDRELHAGETLVAYIKWPQYPKCSAERIVPER